MITAGLPQLAALRARAYDQDSSDFASAGGSLTGPASWASATAMMSGRSPPARAASTATRQPVPLVRHQTELIRIAAIPSFTPESRSTDQ